MEIKTLLTTLFLAGLASTTAAQSIALWKASENESGNLATPMLATTAADGVDTDKTYATLDEEAISDGLYAEIERFAYAPMNDPVLNPDRYIRVLVTPQEGYRISYEKMYMNVWSTVSGATDIAVKTSIDDFQTVIFEAMINRGDHNGFEVDLEELGLRNKSDPIEFRIYFWGAQGKQLAYLADRATWPALEFTGKVRSGKSTRAH